VHGLLVNLVSFTNICFQIMKLEVCKYAMLEFLYDAFQKVKKGSNVVKEMKHCIFHRIFHKPDAKQAHTYMECVCTCTQQTSSSCSKSLLMKKKLYPFQKRYASHLNNYYQLSKHRLSIQKYKFLKFSFIVFSYGKCCLSYQHILQALTLFPFSYH